MLTSAQHALENSPAVCRDTIQILCGSFEDGELEGLIQCLEEDGHICNVFADADLARELGELTRTANRANATIYTIDPRGLVGGPDLDELFVTIGDKVYKRKVRQKGLLNFEAPVTPERPRL